MISFEKLWDTMKGKGISQYALIKKYGVSPAQITRLKRNESVSTHTIEMFCEILDCRVEDIMEYKKNAETASVTSRYRSRFSKRSRRAAPLLIFCMVITGRYT